MTTSFSGRVHSSNLHKVNEEVAKLNKRAKKLGLEPLWLEVGERIVVEHTNDITGLIVHVEVFYPVTITGESPVINGWKLVAVLNHFEGQNLLRVVPGEILPESYRNEPQKCDHCGHNRFRKDTFVVQHEDGTYKQVGSGCVADFLGHKDPKKLLAFAEYPKIFADGFEGWGTPSPYSTEIHLISFLAATNAAINKFGWVSATKARENGGEPTYQRVVDHFSQRPVAEVDRFSVTKDDVVFAEQAIEWVKTLNPHNGTSDYVHNIQVVVNLEMINGKTYGVAASIIASYKNALNRAAEKKFEAKVSKHVGQVGDKIVVKATFLSRGEYENKYVFSRYSPQVSYVYKFVDEEGNIFNWFTGTHFDLNRGDQVRLTGTVKTHSEYQGIKQTVLTRCKIEGF